MKSDQIAMTWLLRAIPILGLVSVLSPAHAAPIYALDTFLAQSTLPNSGDATELAWIRGITGDDTLTMNFKVNTPNPSAVLLDNDPALANNDLGNSWYIDVAPSTPGYFVVKFGGGNLPAAVDTHYAFTNVADLTKLVFSNAQVDGATGSPTCQNCNVGRLSHYIGSGTANQPPPNVCPPGTIGTPPICTTPPADVPEPGVLFLMGAGLLGLGMARRRKYA